MNHNNNVIGLYRIHIDKIKVLINGQISIEHNSNVTILYRIRKDKIKILTFKNIEL